MAPDGSPSSVGVAWLAARERMHRRGLRTGLMLSVVLHAGVVGFLLLEPVPEVVRVPEVISVKMVALPGAPPAPPKAAPKAAASKPDPTPVPARAPAPAPKKVILPKRPAPVSKKRKPKPEPLEYDDALAALRDELGEPDPPPTTEDEETEDELVEAMEALAATEGAAEEDREFARWRLATRRHMRQNWVVPPDFLGKGLVTGLLVTLRADGLVIGQPEVTHTSGDPYFDENTVRALVRASPLPPPPNAGEWPFKFSADEGP